MKALMNWFLKGLSPVEIIDGYNIALKKAQEILPSKFQISK